MHFEILVEDQSGRASLDILVPKLIGNTHTFRVHSYKGIGRIPRGLGARPDPSRRILLASLPGLLRGYGRTFSGYPGNYRSVVILVCDLDGRPFDVFLAELKGILGECDPRPETRFCIAIEEGEAWFLGDIPALKAAYPKARDAVLNTYRNDSIVGTWELLADAIFPGGSVALSANGWQSVGKEKSIWAEKIAPHMDVDNNKSPSFCFFRDNMRRLAGGGE